MARQSIDLPLAERIAAYWQACQVLRRQSQDRWQYWRAQRVIVVLARCESTYRLRSAARGLLADTRTDPPKGSRKGSSPVLRPPEAPGDLAS
jgi:hypothetical protein